MERELLKGNTPTMILAVLGDGPLHGYAIARRIEERSGNALKFKEGTLYPALHALERQSFVASHWETEGGGPARKVYTLTAEGRAELARRTEMWRQFSRAINDVIGGKRDEQTA